MEVGGPGDVGHWGPHLSPRMDNVHSEGVHGVTTDVVPVDPGDEDLTLVVVAKQATDHGEVVGAERVI